MSGKMIIHSESIFGAKTGLPLVKIVLEGKEVIIPSADARQFALDLLDCAHASEGDAFLIDFVHKEVGVPIEAAAVLLKKFRDHREQTKEKFKDLE